MKVIKLTYLSLLIMLSFLSCKNDAKYSYAIKDFDKTLQPYLTQIVSKGIVGYDTAISYVETHASDKELTELGNSEHPVLRAVAFRIMLRKPSFNHFDILMGHLDDTAVVATDYGEFGIRYCKVSDDIIENGRWKTIADKNRTIDALITKHNYLSTAYEGLLDVESNEKYYFLIKEMLQKERPFREIDDALWALAAFKKKEDIQLIKDIISLHSHEIDGSMFKLIEKFPNETYLEIFEQYYPRRFYRSICLHDDNELNECFLNSLASYKNERSAKILGMILNQKPFLPCIKSHSDLYKKNLIYAIWNHQCPAYAKLKLQVEPIVKKYEKDEMNEKKYGDIIPETVIINEKPDDLTEPIRWKFNKLHWRYDKQASE